MFCCGYDPGLQAWLQIEPEAATPPPRWLAALIGALVLAGTGLLFVVQP